jgi:hypothetical protein
MNLVRPMLALIMGAFLATPLTAAPFNPGDFVTFNHDDWGDASSAAGILLRAHYDEVYGATGQVLEVGIPGFSGFSMQFTDRDLLLVYLPDNGVPGALTADYGNPGFTSSGQFGSLLVGLKLNIDFSDAGFLASSYSVTFGDLIIGPDTSGLPPLFSTNQLTSPFYGLTVRQFASLANRVLGGELPYSSSYVQTVELLNLSFPEQQPISDTAQRQLSYPAPAPVEVPEPASWSIMLVGLGLAGGARRLFGHKFKVVRRD